MGVGFMCNVKLHWARRGSPVGSEARSKGPVLHQHRTVDETHTAKSTRESRALSGSLGFGFVGDVKLH